jgi:hypothetical protein
MKIYLTAITIITLLLSACCPTVSVNPLSDPSELDKRLEGVWKYDSKEDEHVYLHIGEKSENTMEALSVEHKENGNLDVIKIPFFITKTTANNYLNVRLEDLENEISEEHKGYLFLKYVFIDKDTLHLFLLDDQPIISAIQNNKLKGEITSKNKIVPEGTKPSDVHSDTTIDCYTITDTSTNILNFIETGNNDELFTDAMKFIRIK